MSGFGYVWTAPVWQGISRRRCRLVGCSYVFGLFARCDDRWPYTRTFRGPHHDVRFSPNSRRGALGQLMSAHDPKRTFVALGA